MNTEQRYLVMLDTLLDTRLGKLVTINPTKAAEIDHLSYSKRKHDNFWDVYDWVDEEKFTSVNEDVTLLMNALVTNFVRELAIQLKKQLQLKASHNGSQVLSFTINLYPYVLSEDEKIELVKTVQSLLEDTVPVNTCFVPYESMTPGYINSNYDFVGMYEMDKWLNLHSTSLETAPMAGVTWCVPGIFRKEIGEDAMEKLEMTKEDDALATLEFMLAPYMNLVFRDAMTFSRIPF